MKNIIIISPEAWGINYVSKHHYALTLSQRGDKVWFVNPPQVRGSIKTQIINDNLVVVSYSPVIRGKNRLSDILSRFLHRLEIKKIIGVTGKPDIVWSFDPFRFQWLDDFNASVKIYHPVDDMKRIRLERIITKRADVVLSTADAILKKLKPFNRNCIKIPHGCNIKYNKHEHENFTLPGKNKIKACYVGNFYKVLDLELIIQLTELNEDIDFIFIGPTGLSNLGKESFSVQQLDLLRGKKNAYLIGEVPANNLQDYLCSMDINFVVYKEKQLNPHKILIYLYSGNVTISTAIDEYNDNSLLLQAQSNDNFLNMFSQIKSNLPYYNCELLRSKRKKFAEQHSYENLLKRIDEVLIQIEDSKAKLI